MTTPRASAAGVFVHEAWLDVDDAWIDAPGGAVTLELCGAWEHPPPCPLAAHATSAARADAGVRVRTVFVATPDDEPVVRALIAKALSRASSPTPAGGTARWTVLRQGSATPTDGERAGAARMAAS